MKIEKNNVNGATPVGDEPESDEPGLINIGLFGEIIDFPLAECINSTKYDAEPL